MLRQTININRVATQRCNHGDFRLLWHCTLPLSVRWHKRVPRITEPPQTCQLSAPRTGKIRKWRCLFVGCIHIFIFTLHLHHLHFKSGCVFFRSSWMELLVDQWQHVSQFPNFNICLSVYLQIVCRFAPKFIVNPFPAAQTTQRPRRPHTQHTTTTVMTWFAVKATLCFVRSQKKQQNDSTSVIN